MRLSAIKATKARLSAARQALSSEDISDRLVHGFQLKPREQLRRKIGRFVAPIALRLQQQTLQERLRLPLPFPYNLLCLGERFGSDASTSELLRLTKTESLESVLVPGCYLGSEDVQAWLRRGVKRLDGIDAYSLEKKWRAIIPALRGAFGGEISFRQASIDDLPYPDGRFDLVVSSGVLEHVQNLQATVDETARVLREGGWAHHEIGPLYHCFGGDHCIAALGFEHGYDHLLLDDDTYGARITDQPLFDTHPDPNLPFWARHEQFSFATASEYIDALTRRFRIMHLVVKISEDALAYRQAFPDKWQALVRAGVSEADLLLKSLGLVLTKR